MDDGEAIGDRSSSLKSFLNVCVCVWMSVHDMFNLFGDFVQFTFLFVLLLLLATLNKLEHIYGIG